jgi:WD40 repeat protein
MIMNAARLSACLLLLAAAPAVAQVKEHPGRRERATPGLVIETGARTAACDVLTFTADGKHLLATGDDKVVRSWAVSAAGLGADSLPTLRWPVFREYRGNIYTMALSPDPGQTRVVVAGHGQLRGAFSAAVLNRLTGAILHGTGNPPGAPQQGTVWASGWAPSGDRVALGAEFGAVWVWDLAANKLEQVGQHDTSGEPDPTNHYVRLAAFDGENRVVSVCGTGEVCVWDRGNPGQPVARHKFDRPTGCPVVLSPDRKWIGYVPDAHGQKQLKVELVSFPDAKETRRVELTAPGELPHRLAISGNGRYLAVAVRRVGQEADGATFFQERGGRVRVFDLANPAAPPAEGPAQGLYAESLAFHPTREEWLAVAGGTNHDVAVWDWRTGKPVGEVPQPGRCVWGVSLSTDGNRVSFQTARNPQPTDPNRRGAGPWQHFDLSARRFVRQPDFTPTPTPDRSPGGWKVITVDPDNRRADVWLVEKDGKRFPLPWSRSDDEFPRCYAFLPAAGGKPERLVVGHYWGASVFDLTPAGPVRAAVLRGHEGYVSALATSADGRRLVTGSRDMTLAGWTLDDWDYHPRLGADIFPQGGKLVVGRIAIGSPVWEMGLDEGAEIVAIQVPDRAGAGAKAVTKYDRTGAAGPADPAAAAAFLRGRVNPGTEHVFQWVNPGDPQVYVGVTTVIDRPLWRFFPQADNEWVLWRWRDYYYDCSTKGDSRIGWQRSDRLTDLKKPEFFKAEQLRAEFLKPERIAATLASWQTEQAVLKFNDIEPPAVTVSEPEPTPTGYRVTVTATAAGRQENQQPGRVLVWVNDYLLDNKPAAEGGTYRDVFDIPADKLRRGDNLITAQCYSRGRTRADAPPRTITTPGTPAAPTLHALLVGVGDYSPSRPRQDPLAADEDAQVIDRVLGRQGGFAGYKPDLLLNRQVTRAAILGRLAALRKTVQPDDVLVFYLGGHGSSRAELRKAKVTDARLAGVGRFLFACPDYDFDRLPDTTLNFEDLHDALGRLPCHKLVLLDACHSGAAQTAGGDTDANPVRILTQHGVGPVILAACGPDEAAIEAPLTFDRLTGARGVFTIALRRTLEEPAGFKAADADGDGRLSMAELAAGVTKQAAAVVAGLADRGLLKGLGGAGRQTPVAVIPKLEAAVAIGRR